MFIAVLVGVRATATHPPDVVVVGVGGGMAHASAICPFVVMFISIGGGMAAAAAAVWWYSLSMHRVVEVVLLPRSSITWLALRLPLPLLAQLVSSQL